MSTTPPPEEQAEQRNWWRRALLVGALLAIVAAPVAQADGLDVQTVPHNPQTEALYQSWVDAAAGNVPVGHGVVQVYDQSCAIEGMLGEATYCVRETDAGHVIDFPDLSYLYEEAGHSRRDRVMIRAQWLHELGHILDVRTGQPRRYRHTFRWALDIKADGWTTRPQRERDHPEYAWWTGTRQSDGRTVILPEQFAMAYSWCAFDPHSRGDRAEYAPGYKFEPTHEEYLRACRAVRSMGQYLPGV